MSALSGHLLKLVLMGLAFAVAALLLRDALALGAHVALDPDEGWNAYLARAVMDGSPLYPQDLMINNYPPLSFLILGGLGRVTGDPLLAGRILSLVSFLAVAGSLVALLREMGADVLAALSGGLFFAAGLLVASDYVAMNDPQLLGHALQITGLLLLVAPRRHIGGAALLMAAGIFIKHDLIALPLAAALWLWREERPAAVLFASWGLALCLGGLIASRLLLRVDLLSALASARLWRMENFRTGVLQFLSWCGPCLALTVAAGARRWRDRWMGLVLVYMTAALLLGGLFSFGDGVDTNIFFDAAIAGALGLGLVLHHAPRWRGVMALVAAAPLLLFHHRHAADADFAYSEAFARESSADIAFLRGHPGPALCENLTLCYWAGEQEPVDVFNLSEAFASRARGDAGLARLLQQRHFGVIVLDRMTPFALGPHLKTVMRANYRPVRQDDNGVFLEPR